MADDPRVEWHIANRYGIWMNRFENQGPWLFGHVDSSADRWCAGRAMDVLELKDGTLFLASHKSGIWLMSGSGTNNFCISDFWDDAAFRSLAQGPDSDFQVFAGGENAALYMTDLSQPNLLLNDWIKLDSLKTNFIDGKDVGDIYDILVLPGSRVIVVACTLGVVWSRIPPVPVLLSSSPDSFVWKKAVFENIVFDKPGHGIFSLAEGPASPNISPVSSTRAAIKESLLAGGIGGTDHLAGLFVGDWEEPGKPDTLVLKPAKLLNQTVDISSQIAAMSFSVVASFAPDRLIGYAACASSIDDALLLFAHTADGGRHWHVVGNQIVGTIPLARLSKVIGVTQGGGSFCIGVSNMDSKVVSIGAQNGVISFDGGSNWQKPGFRPRQNPKPDENVDFPTTDHLHADLKSIVFSRANAASPIKQNAYKLTSDGGLAEVRWGTGAWVIESDRDSNYGSLFVTVLEGNSLLLFKRSRQDSTWTLETSDTTGAPVPITSMATGAGCLIQSSFMTGDSQKWQSRDSCPRG